MTRSTSPTTGRLPSLDGLRAVAVLVVMFSHATGAVQYSALGTFRIPNPAYALGATAVRLFFILSGFLLTSQLLHERETRGDIAIARFYRRRALRVLPAYLFYLACVLVLGWFAVVDSPSRADLAWALSFTVNYAAHPAWTVVHLWSLAVEVQFYLLLPLLVRYCREKALRRALVVVILTVPLLRAAESIALGEWGSQLVGHTFESACDALAWGCLLAAFRGSPSAWVPGFARRHGEVLLVGGLAAGLVLVAPSRPVVAALIGIPVTNALMALLTLQLVDAPHSVVGRLLNSPVVLAVGAVSYSLYLWQQPFLGPATALHAWTLPLIAGCAMFSYLLVERPVQRRARKPW